MNESVKPRTKARKGWLIEIMVGGVIALAWVVVQLNYNSRAHVIPNDPRVHTKLPITPETGQMVIGSSAVNKGRQVAKEYLVQRQILWIAKSRPDTDALMISQAFEHLKKELKRRTYLGEGRDLPPGVRSLDGSIVVVLTPKTVNQFQSGQGRFYLLRRLAWSDASGPHATNSCEYLDSKHRYRWFECKSEY